MEPALKHTYDDVVDGHRSAVESGVKAAVDAGLPVTSILNEALIAAMQEVGARFERQDFYMPEMLVAARAMQSGLKLLKPRLVQAGVPAAGKVVLGTVKGDLHGIGKSLVGRMLEGAGFGVIDLGTDVSPETFAEAVRTHRPQLVGLAALLTTTMQDMKSTLEALEVLGVRSQARVMVGGPPVTDAFAKEIGADGYAPDANRTPLTSLREERLESRLTRDPQGARRTVEV